MSATKQDKYGGWSNRQTERMADDIFGGRQTFFFVKGIISEGKNLDEQSTILCELMTGWMLEMWEDGVPKREQYAVHRVNWKELSREIMDYNWGF